MKIPFSKSFEIISFLLFVLIGTTSSQITECPFHFLYQFGDGITDIGNSIRVVPFGLLLPPTRNPYGRTFPGRPTGRWSDGLVVVDYFGQGFGLPDVKQYLSLDFSTSYNGVAYSTAGSTVLDTQFYNSRRITVPPYNIPLSTQLNWFRNYVNPLICTNQRDCSNRQLPNSVIVIGFAEANDIGYALEQGRSIEEVTSYVPLIVDAQVNAAREAINRGATRVIYSTAAPLGCYPYILTALFTNDPTAYDEQGCLRAVNNVIVSLNTALRTTFAGLKAQYPSVVVEGADFYTAARTVINQTSALGSIGNPALRSCCGIGGRYNYDSTRFCGSLNVPVCPNPNDYVYWDGLHFTQEAYRRIVKILLPAARTALNCTST